MKMIVSIAIVLCLALAPVAAAEEEILLTCPISLDLNTKLNKRLRQLKGILEQPAVVKDDVWSAIISAELFTLEEIQEINISWYRDSCSES